ncbi:unnamed protein product [Miscanthus lutarioriparius]|uniref:C2H2-type domain-containing protein n=1 Tax=Miscanthus lutarioriparius TaxID=422564 RepID=A0A811QRD9_9POAL|nr:unnamed protein product [Miscanthus lutarioriparius]
MVEPGRSVGVREAKKSSSSSSSTAATMVKKKLTTTKKRPEKEEKAEKKQSRQCTEPESPSYRLALKSLFSCRNSHGHGQHHARPRAQQDTGTGSRSKRLGCSAPSICKLKDDSDNRHQRVPVPPPEEIMGGTASASAGEPCKRRASVSGSSERCVKKPLSEAKCGTGRSSSATAASSNSKQLQRGGLSSSSSGGSSFRAGMQLRRLSGCYECHMVVDPVSGSTSMRATAATICPCPDCGEVFVRQESLHLHQSIRHAVSELGADDTSRNIIEIIFQSSWLKKQSPVCKVDRILKVHNTPRTLARFEEYRDAVKAGQQPVAIGAKNSNNSSNRHPRCTADGNELLRFHCATLACSLGLNGATHLCDAAGAAASGGCAACGIIRDGFSRSAGDGGVLTMATSGRAHDAVPVAPGAEGGGLDEEAAERRRAMLVCRVIAGRVKRPKEEEQAASVSVSEEEEEEYDSVAGSAGVYSNLEELVVFNPRAILPCFVVVYKA